MFNIQHANSSWTANMPMPPRMSFVPNMGFNSAPSFGFNGAPAPGFGFNNAPPANRGFYNPMPVHPGPVFYQPITINWNMPPLYCPPMFNFNPIMPGMWGGFGMGFPNAGWGGGWVPNLPPNAGWCPPNDPPDCGPKERPRHRGGGDCDPPKKDPPRKDPPKKDPPKCDTRDIKGRVWGDPHFEGADGERYDIRGVDDKTYNLLSDDNVRVNARFDHRKNGTAVMDQLGFLANGKKIGLLVDDKGKTQLTVDGKSYSELGKNIKIDDSISWNAKEKKLIINAKSTGGESWNFSASVEGTRIDLDIRGSKIGGNETATTGLWGHSLDGKKSDTDKKDKDGGGGVIREDNGKVLPKDVEGARYLDALRGYEVNSLFGLNDRWNTF